MVWLQRRVPEMPTVQAEKHALPMVFIGQHGIDDAADGAEEVTRWKFGADHPGGETCHGCSVMNAVLPICLFVHTLQHGRPGDPGSRRED